MDIKDIRLFLSPSKQPDNAYATGNTNENEQMEKLALKIKEKWEALGGFCHTYLMEDGIYYLDRPGDAEENGATHYSPLHTNALNGRTKGSLIMYSYDNDKNSEWANLLRDGIDAVTPWPERYGIWDNGNDYEELAELSGDVASIYVEVDFHDNKEVSAWIQNNIETLADVYVKALLELEGIDKDVPKVEPKQIDVPEEIKGYISVDALKKDTGAKMQEAGKYYVYKEYQEYLNITKKQGVPGAWVDIKNPVESTPDPQKPDADSAKFMMDEVAKLVKKYAGPGTALPSVLIAQIMLETGMLTSELWKNANNPAGIKWSVPYTNLPYYEKVSPEWVNGQETQMSSKFVKFNTPEEGIMFMAKHMRSTKEREKIYDKVLKATDYKTQAQGLSGTWATDPNYGTKLINLIEKYDLTKYDSNSPVEAEKPVEDKEPTKEIKIVLKGDLKAGTYILKEDK